MTRSLGENLLLEPPAELCTGRPGGHSSWTAGLQAGLSEVPTSDKPAWRPAVQLVWPIAFLLITCFIAVSAFAADPPCARIVSTAPSITESLYALELGANVVGVSRYTNFPEEAKSKTKVGDLFQLNIEAISRLRPTLVVSLSEQSDSLQPLERLSVPVLAVNHRTMEGILDSFITLSARCAVPDRGAALRQRLLSELSHLKEAAPVPPRRFLILIAEEVESLGQQFWMSGNDGFYNELLPYVGGENVYTGKTLGLLQLALEGAVSLRPDIIVLIVPPEGSPMRVEGQFRAMWQRVEKSHTPMIRAIAGDDVIVPGPRMVELARKLSQLVNEEMSA